MLIRKAECAHVCSRVNFIEIAAKSSDFAGKSCKDYHWPELGLMDVKAIRVPARAPAHPLPEAGM